MRVVVFKGSFGNVILVTLFKCCENTYGRKSIVEIRIVLFKQRKLLFKQHKQTPTKYQTDPKFLYLLKFKYKHDKNCEIYFVYRFIVLSL